jgi:hypothetical protein
MLFSPDRYFSYQTDLKVGSIATKDVIAPFDFDIYKPQDRLIAEQERAIASVLPIYKVSENLKFNAQKNLDFIFQHFNDPALSAEEIHEKLKDNGYPLSEESIDILMDIEVRRKIYTYMSERLSRIFDIGIYPNTYPHKTIKVVRNDQINEYALSRLYSMEESEEHLVENYPDSHQKPVIEDLANLTLIENIIVDQDLTNIEKQRARESVSPTVGKVLRNERIISKNQRITHDDMIKLNSLIRAQREREDLTDTGRLLLNTVGIFLLSFILLILVYYLIAIFFSADYLKTPLLIVLLLSFLLSIIMTIFVNNILQLSPYFIPFSLSILIIAMLFRPFIGIISTFFNMIFISMFLNWIYIIPLIMALSTYGAIIGLKKIKNKDAHFPLLVYLIGSFVIIYSLFNALTADVFTHYLTQMLYGVISCIISVSLLVIILPFVEKRLDIATKSVLLDLINFDNELLKRMSITMPGTYHHSLIVGNLAESAAEAIGANHLLARVASYYHDIGKMENPEIFVENNPNSDDMHEKLLANESAKLIRTHVQNGVSLAKKYKLPKAVIEIIKQHHGTSMIKYFYHKAQETNLDSGQEDYYYQGPKPQSKEAAILMIADIVESTTKALDSYEETKIKKVLDNTVKRLINEGQLNEAPITLKELETVKAYMLPILTGVYRKRIDYPTETKADN